jgi:hypothetical protein
LNISPYPIFPRPKNSFAEDIFNNIFLIKKYSDKPPSTHHLALPVLGLRQTEEIRRVGPHEGVLSAVCLLLLKQSHGQLCTAPQTLQVAEAAAVVEVLTQPRTAVPHRKLLHQPWLYGSKEVEP